MKKIIVLLVEDNPGDARLINEYLKISTATPIELITKETLRVAIDFLLQNKVDAILLDLALPDSNGQDTFKKINEKFPSIPIIILTGLGDDNVALSLMKQGAQDYLPKNQIFSELLVRSIIYSIERKQSVDALKISEENFRLLHENAGIGVGVYSLDGRILKFNQKAIQNLGGTFEDYEGKTLSDIFGANDGAIYEQRIKDAVNSETSIEFEDYVVTGSGAYWFLSNFTKVKDPNGKITAVQVLAHDITERKKSENKLKESENQYRVLFENSLMAISEANIDSHLIHVNKAYANMYGFDNHNELIKDDVNVTNFYANPDDRKQVLQILNEKGLMEAKEFELVRKDGTHFFALVNATSIKDSSGNTVGYQANHIDISQWKKAKQELSETRSLHKIVCDSTADLIWSVDPVRFGLTSFNSGLRDFFLEADNLQIKLGFTPDDLLTPDFAKKWHDFYHRVLNEGPFKTEYLSHKGIIRLELNLNVLKRGDEVFGISVFGKDITRRKEAEEELQASKDYLNNIINAVATPIFVKDTEHRMCLVNDAYCSFLNLTVEDCIGFTGFEQFPKEQSDVFVANDLLVFKTGEENVSEELITDGQGRVSTIITKKTLYTDKNGNKFIVGVINDITKRKQMEDSLKESETSLRYAQEIAKMGSWEWDLTTKNVKWSDNYYTLLGYDAKKEEPSFELFINRIHPDDLPFFEAMYPKVIEEKKQIDFEFRMIHPDGRVMWIQNNVVPIFEDGKISKLKGAFIDITERKKAEIAVRESEEKYRTIFENVQDVFYQTDVEGIVLELSPSIKHFAEFERNEVLGKSVVGIYNNPEDRTIFLEELMKTGELKDYEIVMKTKTGELKYTSHNARIIRDHEGKPRRIDGALRDISRRKKVEALLQQALDNMEKQVLERTAELADANFKLQLENEKRQQIIEKEKELNMLKTRFISVVSHEFRTPLTGIYSSVQLIDKYGDKWDHEKKQKHFGLIYNSVRFANLLLDDVSLIGRAESGKMNYNQSLCTIGEICEQAINDIKGVSENPNEIVFSMEPEISTAIVDESLLRHILNNVLSNAVKYSRQGKAITFKVIIADAENCKEKKQNLVFTIADEGIGIPEDDVKYLFEPFSRASNVEAIQGTGLGLSIVKHCVELHEGSIEIKSKENFGTTVIIKIPYRTKNKN